VSVDGALAAANASGFGAGSKASGLFRFAMNFQPT